MVDEGISRELLSDQVYELVRASILDGSRAPGSRLVESDIARRLSISQAPVREAVKRLVHDGLVTSVARKGSYVTEISPEEYAIAREMRASLEQVGARAAARDATDDDLAHLDSLVGQMDAAVKKSDWAAFRTLDMQFHGSVMAIGGHAVLPRLWATLEPLLVSQRAIGDPAYLNPSKLVTWHEDLVATLRAGDPGAAGEAFYEHAAGTLAAG